MGFLTEVQKDNFYKEKEYLDYIQTHVYNVKRAFYDYGKDLCKTVGADWEQVQSMIEKHDSSKYGIEEFSQYRKKWHPYEGEEFTPEDRLEYDKAWCHHINNNPHHPEYWIVPEYPNNKVLDMPPECLVEMICDWQSFNYIGRGNAYDFYYNKDKKEGLMSQKTRELLEAGLEIIHNKKED